MSRVKAVAFSCPHAPLEDRDAISWALEVVGSEKPDVLICLGDLFEADSASRWPSEYDWPLSHELRTGNDLLRAFRDASGGARCVFLPGNHDDNLLAINRIDRKLRDLVDWRTNPLVPELSEGRWEQPCIYEYSSRGVFPFWQFMFAHGYLAAVSSDKTQAVKASNDLKLPKHGLFVSGHTHRPIEPTQVHMSLGNPMPYYFANVGCLRDMENVPYMSRKDRFRWGHGIFVGECETWRYAKTMEPTEKCWEAKVLIRRYFEEKI